VQEPQAVPPGDALARGGAQGVRLPRPQEAVKLASHGGTNDCSIFERRRPVVICPTRGRDLRTRMLAPCAPSGELVQSVGRAKSLLGISLQKSCGPGQLLAEQIQATGQTDNNDGERVA